MLFYSIALQASDVRWDDFPELPSTPQYNLPMSEEVSLTLHDRQLELGTSFC